MTRKYTLCSCVGVSRIEGDEDFYSCRAEIESLRGSRLKYAYAYVGERL